MMCAAGPVDRHSRIEIVRLHDLVRQYPRFDFLAADVGEHLAVDFDARTEHLTALFNHFLALGQVVDDVARADASARLSSVAAVCDRRKIQPFKESPAMMCATGPVDRHFRREIVRLHDLVR